MWTEDSVISKWFIVGYSFNGPRNLSHGEIFNFSYTHYSFLKSTGFIEIYVSLLQVLAKNKTSHNLIKACQWLCEMLCLASKLLDIFMQSGFYRYIC